MPTSTTSGGRTLDEPPREDGTIDEEEEEPEEGDEGTGSSPRSPSTRADSDCKVRGKSVL